MQPAQKKKLTNIFTSVVVISSNDSLILKARIRQIHEILSEYFDFFELLIVENGSTDQSINILKQLQLKYHNIRVLGLSRHYNTEIAYTAGLENCIGDYVILMNLYTDPPKFIPDLVIKAISENFDIVTVELSHRARPYYKKLLYNIITKVTNDILGIRVAVNTTYFRLFSRRTLNSLIKIKNKSRHLKYFNAVVGFRQSAVVYEAQSSMLSRRDYFRSLGVFLDLLFSYSNVPLRLVTILGMLGSTLSFVYILYVFFIHLVKRNIVEGWTTLSLVSASMFFLLFLILTVMSEYIARISTETKDQPLYFISEEYNSSVIRHTKLNVTDET